VGSQPIHAPFFRSFSWSGVAIGGVVGWIVGSKYHCGKVTKKLNTKHKEEQKALYQQYYTDVYTLQEQNSELIKALEKMGVRIQR
jgi:hypothetical protein